MVGKVSQQDAVMSSSLNTTPYQGGCHGFTDWNGTAEKRYSLEFLSHQIPNPHLALVLILQQFRWEESWKLAKGESVEAAFPFSSNGVFNPRFIFMTFFFFPQRFSLIFKCSVKIYLCGA